MNPLSTSDSSGGGRPAADGPKYPVPSDELPPSYSSLYLAAASTVEPLLVPSAAAAASDRSVAPAAAVHVVGEPPSYAETLGRHHHHHHHPLPPPAAGTNPKWESVPLGVASPPPPQRPQQQQYVVVVTSPARESLPKVCCCIPLREGTIFLAVLKMIWIAFTIFVLSFFLSRMSDYYLHEETKDIIFMTCVARICLEAILFLATVMLIVGGIIKRRREFFSYYFIMLAIIYSLNVIATIYLAYNLNTGLTYRGGLPFVFDVYFCWKLIRYYNHLGRNAPVATAP